MLAQLFGERNKYLRRINLLKQRELSQAHRWSPSVFRLLGYATPVAPTIKRLLSHVQPDQRPELLRFLVCFWEKGSELVELRGRIADLSGFPASDGHDARHDPNQEGQDLEFRPDSGYLPYQVYPV